MQQATELLADNAQRVIDREVQKVWLAGTNVFYGDNTVTSRGAITSAVTGATNGKQQTERGFRAYFRWVANDHDAFLLLFGSRANRDEESTATIRRLTAETAIAIAPLIAADIDSDHQHLLAQGLVGLAEGVSRHLVERGMEFDPDEVGQQVADLAWAGLRAVHRNP